MLEKKLNELERANDYECWYLVKQPTDFDALCYLVSFLKEYKANNVSKPLQEFISAKIVQLSRIKTDVSISDNYRALRVAAFFGLIRMTNANYANAIITETFDEITKRCNGEYEKTDLYLDIIQRQIEKMFISSSVDEEYNKVRKDYRLYPVMLLYKVLLEMGRSTGKYAISMTDYRYLVATTKKFEDFLDTLLLIKLLHEDSQVASKFEHYKTKFDNRLIRALRQLPTIKISNDGIFLREEHIGEVAHKVFVFESNPSIFTTTHYLEFLSSKRSLFDLSEPHSNSSDFVVSERLNGGTNTILYGVPGSGKSWTIKNEYCSDESCIERIVFHPDYTYSDFIGQILPRISDDGSVSYEFVAGPFTKLLHKAHENPNKMFYLVIEEINRGNAPAIFGDVFQLLDRNDDGGSEYEITNEDIAKFVYQKAEQKVSIPSNMSILCTMNTSGQNVFTLDTAFQRRWDMRLIKNKFNETESEFAKTKILDTDVTWEHFVNEINKIILSKNIRMTSSEDKRLGTHFVVKKDIELRESNKKQISKFPEKVLKYLWDDAFKFNREDIFDLDRVKSLEDVIDKFIESIGNGRFLVFKDNIYNALISKNESN